MADGSASMSTMGRIRPAGGVPSGSAWRSARRPAMTVLVSGSVSRSVAPKLNGPGAGLVAMTATVPPLIEVVPVGHRGGVRRLGSWQLVRSRMVSGEGLV